MQSNLSLQLSNVGRNELTISQEYKSIPDSTPPNRYLVEAMVKYKTAFRVENKNLIRWDNICPLEKTRVKLHPAVTKHQFIEASYVNVGKGTVISASAPVKNAFGDWWGMIWLHGVKEIYCLTNFVEKGVTKMHQYWPELNKPIVAGKFSISRREPVEDGDPTVTGGKISSDLEMIPLTVRRITSLSESVDTDIDCFDVNLYRFTGWPDFGVPTNTRDVCFMLRKMYETLSVKGVNTRNSVVTHCSAGCGRTGVMVASLRALFTGEDAFTAVSQIRKDRQGMVQTSGQFGFVKKMVRDYSGGEGTTHQLEERRWMTQSQRGVTEFARPANILKTSGSLAKSVEESDRQCSACGETKVIGWFTTSQLRKGREHNRCRLCTGDVQ